MNAPASELCYVYTWHPGSGNWQFRDVVNGEEAAKEYGRLLWRAGAAGIKIDVTKTIVETTKSNKAS